MKRYCIYTAMVGGYDNILQPQYIDDRFDYILFSNDIRYDHIGVWQVRRIDYHNDDNTRICRYVKTHPHTLLHEYEFTIWMDSNVQIITDFIYKRAFELYDLKVQISSCWHNVRDCIYDEAFTVMMYSIESEQTVIKWCHKLKKEKYPIHNGLFETNVVFRLSSDSNTTLNELWWSCIDSYSKRDQLSFNYCLWKQMVKCPYLINDYQNT